MTDIDSRINAWYDATQHPERASDFLKAGVPVSNEIGGRQVSTKASDVSSPKKVINAIKRKQMLMEKDEEDDADKERRLRWKRYQPVGSEIGANRTRSNIYEWVDYEDDTPAQLWETDDIHPDLLKKQAESGLRMAYGSGAPMDDQQVGIASLVNHHNLVTKKQPADFSKAVFDDDEADAAAEDAAAEDAMDDFEAQGKAHMLETKKERNKAVQPVVHADDKVRGAETVGRESKALPRVAAWDANIDTSAYLEDLLGKGMITPEQYARARQAYMDGRTS